MTNHRIAGSFRDPSGFLFKKEGVVYRQINPSGAVLYDALMGSGLYESLVKANLLIAHEEVDVRLEGAPDAYKVIRPVQLPLISYPYEWSFGQLKAAALLTLTMQKKALEKGMVLRDASAYNVQFHEGRPVFIDTLSFGPYTEGELWVAYQQFCKHFLAPLALMAKVDVSLLQLLRANIDGIPLDLASKLLPFSTKLSPFLLTHLHLHASSTRKYADAAASGGNSPVKPGAGMSKDKMVTWIESLKMGVDALDWTPTGTEWGDYYANTNYTKASHEHKSELVAEFVGKVGAKVVWDLGANTGVFSKIAANQGAKVYSFDIDPAAVERNWRNVVAEKETRILPLLQDLTNPSPAIGWDLDERSSFLDRGPTELAMALALIHHIAISNNVPLQRISKFLQKACKHLIIEFVPKEDSQVRRLLATREDIFPDYHLQGFERAFSEHFRIVEKREIRESVRTLYLLERL